MERKNLIQVLKSEDSERIYNELRDFSKEKIDKDIFDILVSLIGSQNPQVVFIALDLMIQYCSKYLKESGNQITSTLIDLFLHENSPVVCRADWALSIIGEPGIDDLLSRYSESSMEMKCKIIWSFGKGKKKLDYKKEEIMNLLYQELDNKNEAIRFNVMHTIMNISPLRPFIPSKIQDYDFITIYEKLLLVVKYFKEKESSKGMAKYFHELIWKKLESKK